MLAHLATVVAAIAVAATVVAGGSGTPAEVQVRDELAAARLDLASKRAEATAAADAARREHDTAEATRRELEALRSEARTERETLRAAHTDQIAQIQHQADQRAEALNHALEALRTQTAPPGENRNRKAPRDPQRPGKTTNMTSWSQLA